VAWDAARESPRCRFAATKHRYAGTVPGVVRAVATALLLASAPAAAEDSPLFLLARNKNANVVEYAVRTGAGGRLDVSNPIDVHWLLRAEDGRRAELNLFERLLAYGVHVHVAASGDGCELQIVSLPARRIQIRRGREGYEADTVIGGSASRLDSIFVTAQDGAGLPRVLSIELRGARLADDAPAYERIVPP
jgi:hypothetical protein